MWLTVTMDVASKQQQVWASRQGTRASGTDQDLYNTQMFRAKLEMLLDTIRGRRLRLHGQSRC